MIDYGFNSFIHCWLLYSHEFGLGRSGAAEMQDADARAVRLSAQQRCDLLAEGGYLVVEFLLGSAAEAEVQHIGS